MTEPIDLPPEFERLANFISKQPPHVRDLFRYALVLAMIDDEKARVIGTRTQEEREWLTVETVEGEVFEINRPPISDEVEAELINHVRVNIAEHSGEWQQACDKPRPLWSEDWRTEPRYDETVRLLGLLIL